MEYNFQSKDNYTVFASSILSTQDRKIMSVLYLPLIGTEALALYFVLWADLEGDSVMSKILRPFSRLTSSLDISISHINKACNRLEGLGLLQRYVKDHHYVLVLKSPKSASAFFKHDVLRTMLKDRIGEEEYDRSRMYFAYKPRIPSGYVNVSKRFQDVYDYPDEVSSKDNTELVERSEAKIELNYNFDQLYEGLVNVSKYAFNDKVKEAIGNIMYCYNISIVDMRSIIMKAYNVKDLTVDIDKIRRIAENSYNSNKKEIKVKKEVQVKPKFTGDESIDALINLFETKTVFEFLEYRDGIRPTGPDLDLLIELRSKYNLNDAVLNVIIDYCLKRNDNRLTRAYVLKVASSLQRSKVNTAYDAMMKLNYPNASSVVSTPSKEINESAVNISESDEDVDALIASIERGEF